MAKKFLIEDIKIGMKFSAPLFTKDNNLVLERKVEIKESIYNRFVRWGIKELYTDGDLMEAEAEVKKVEVDNEIKVEPGKKEYVSIYNSILNIYEDFIKKISDSDKFEKVTLDNIVNYILKLVLTYKNEIISFMSIPNKKFDYLVIHGVNTTIIALIGGIELKLSESDLRLLGYATLLHDIGMQKIPKEILNKANKLSDEEFNAIKAHPITTYKFLSKIGILSQPVLDAILQHHEQFDGNGYPRKISGDKINIFAKIISIADTFQAQIASRVYKKSKTGYLAMKSVLAEAKNKFDPQILRAFLFTLSIYPPGTLLQLNNNAVVTVVSVNPDAPLRPKIRILIDELGDKLTEPVVKDLKEESSLFIVNVLNKDDFQKEIQ
jgi:HD-GYP domain-containing protein (c-di-GMP phosphodiesterase class II)